MRWWAVCSEVAVCALVSAVLVGERRCTCSISVDLCEIPCAVLACRIIIEWRVAKTMCGIANVGAYGERVCVCVLSTVLAKQLYSTMVVFVCVCRRMCASVNFVQEFTFVWTMEVHN